MKKTLIAIMALASLSVADEYLWDADKDWSYNWEDFASDPLGGAWERNGTVLHPSIEDVTIKGVESKALTTCIEARRTTSFLKDAISAAAQGEGTLTIAFDYYFKSGNDSWGQNIFHLGQKDKGFTIGASGNGLLSVFNGNNGTDSEFVTKATAMGVSTAMQRDNWYTVGVTFGESNAVTLTLDGVQIGSGTLNEIDWTEYNAYAISERAPGWNGGQNPMTDSGAKMANLAMVYKTASVDPVPEPATGSLSLLALAGLCARRRRK